MSKLKVRNYEYQGKREVKSVNPDKRVRNIVLAIAGILLAVFIVLVCIEPRLKNKLVIDNRSSHEITLLQIWYENGNGDISEVMRFDRVGAKEKLTESTEKFKLSELVGDAWLTVQIAFADGGEAVLQTGQFLSNFEGKLSLEISDTASEELMLHLQAGEGIFNSTAVTDCNDIYYINPENGYIE